MASYVTPGVENDLMYDLFVKHVKDQIREKIQPEVDRILDECVDLAVKSLNGEIHRHYDYLKSETTFKFVLEKK